MIFDTVVQVLWTASSYVMHIKNRFVVKIAGASGQGINSIGDSISHAVKECGLYSFGYREYPSLIKGGYAAFQVDISDRPIRSSSSHCDLLVVLSNSAFAAYAQTVAPQGQIIHSVIGLQISEPVQQFIQAQGIRVMFVPAAQLVKEAAGHPLMVNTLLLGVVWQLLGLAVEPVHQILRKTFAKKPDVIEPNIGMFEKGRTLVLENSTPVGLKLAIKPEIESEMIISGNQAIGLGAVAGGVRVYFAYPMTPASSILGYLASIARETGMFVKQIEDEISVAEMAVGAMFAGTRALCGTSGGGFDLMTETVSLAGMTETPFVCIVAQRPGPATGLPTWTNAGDLLMTIFSGHGEYAKCVLAVSDPESCFTLTQVALNIAEEYQIPVLVLTEKQIAESHYQLPNLPEPIEIKRGLLSETEIAALQKTDRYKDTPTGISPRWVPGNHAPTFDANSDEHLGDGSLTEDAEPSRIMFEKRMRKQATLLQNLPEPILFGPEQNQLLLVGWGSVKNTVLDALEQWKLEYPEAQIAYLHYEYMFPLRTERFLSLASQTKQVVFIENNGTGQLAKLVQMESGYRVQHTFLKNNGRPFFVDEVLTFLKEHQ
jgi:2-oxoglutarate/2-oxoacid ferredoxin oxidoreductase subunit alpha